MVDQYKQVVTFLREKKDRLGLATALREQGHLLLLFGFNDMARHVSIAYCYCYYYYYYY